MLSQNKRKNETTTITQQVSRYNRYVTTQRTLLLPTITLTVTVKHRFITVTERPSSNVQQSLPFPVVPYLYPTAIYRPLALLTIKSRH